MFYHASVLLNETIDNMNIKSDGIYVDATLGGGGHTEKILEKIDEGYVIGIDQDIDAINFASIKLKKYIDLGKLKIVKNNFENIKYILKDLNIKKIDGILFDLGVSSYQFDEGSRGFSYKNNGQLDMRMDRESSLDCYQLVNTFSRDELSKIIREYGEEKFANNIAKHIVEKRECEPIATTYELVDIIKEAIPAKLRWGEGLKNPAKRTFQAFRIYINREFEVIKNTLDDVVDLLNDKGRIVVISFNSLEDKIVKDKFKFYENPCTCPKNLPCVCGRKSKGRMINKSVIIASDLELENNRRAKPAKLRIFERTYKGRDYDKS